MGRNDGSKPWIKTMDQNDGPKRWVTMGQYDGSQWIKMKDCGNGSDGFLCHIISTYYVILVSSYTNVNTSTLYHKLIMLFWVTHIICISGHCWSGVCIGVISQLYHNIYGCIGVRHISYFNMICVSFHGMNLTYPIIS